MRSMAEKKIVLHDTTLRDGEQTAGVCFNLQERIEIAKALCEAGVREMEVGIPAMGCQEQEEIRAIASLRLPATLVSWARMCDEDLNAAACCGASTVNLSVSVSDQQIESKLRRTRDWVMHETVRLIRKAKDMGFRVALGGEDSSRADQEFLHRLLDAAQEAGASRFRFADTLGVLDPFTTFARVSALRERTDLEIEMHAHNDLGMATANSLAAVRGGASHVSTTVNGLGERAGNAALEEVAVALRYTDQVDTGIHFANLQRLSAVVAKASGRQIAVNKAIVGDAIFTHESGIHVSGLLRDRRNYEHLNPELFGRSHHIVLGKHSGAATVRWALEQLGIQASDDAARLVMEKVRRYYGKCKIPMTSSQLWRFYRSVTKAPGQICEMPGEQLEMAS